MPIVQLGAELIPSLNRLLAVLLEHDPVTQQKLLEVMVTRHLMMVGEPHQRFVLESMVKHIKQLLATTPK